ncbi:MAG: TetR/AcrR family transcriptional regulator [Mycolicibacterium sp.]|uniref:TetR family transcriptional regulator n=1 Tax=Mycolicibacterium sp. TaxID=2320850 RepID=UPI003D0FDB55
MPIATDGGYAAVRMRVVAERARYCSRHSVPLLPLQTASAGPALTREFERLGDEDDWATIAASPVQRLQELNARLRHEWQNRPALTEAVTRAFVVADGTVDVVRAEAVLGHVMARAIGGGHPTPHQIQIAAVVADIWLANLTAWTAATRHYRRSLPTAPLPDRTPPS